MKVSQIEKAIAKRQETVGKERDKLDNLISGLTGLKESCDKAWDALQDARDALSELG